MAEDDAIRDVDHASPCVGAVNDIDLISPQEVEQAAREVARAAAEARRREFVQDPESGTDPVTGEERLVYLDLATGDYYRQGTQGQWINTTTGWELDGDPTAVTASDYEWIVSSFTQFHDRDPSVARAMAEDCVSAKTAIQSGRMTAIDGVSEAVHNDWEGAAAVHFRDYFLSTFVNAVNNQQGLLDELAVAMYAYEGVVRRVRLDAKALATEATTVLESLNPFGAGLTVDGNVLLGVIGVATTVVGAVTSQGLSLVLGLINVGTSGLSVVASALPGQEPVSKEQVISGQTVDQVLDSLMRALMDLRRAMDAEELGIAEKLWETRAEVVRLLGEASVQEVATILPNEPNDSVTNLTDGELPSPDEFRPPR